MVELDLKTVNPELAKIVLDVAEECDSRFCDRMVIKLPQIKMKYVIDGQEIELSYAEEIEREEKKRSELKKKIKQMINSDAAIGYIKAYELCGNIDSELTRKIRYKTHENIQYLSYQQKIDICKKYKELDNTCKTQIAEQISKMQYEMIKSGEKFDEQDVLQTFKEAYRQSKEEYRKNRLMWFYNLKKNEDGVIYWEKIFLPVFEGRYEDNIGFFGEIVFDILITKNELDEAEKFLIEWEKNELDTTPEEEIVFNPEMSFIESNKQRLPLLRKGYHFFDPYTKIVCYDGLNVTGDKEQVASIKNRYKKTISKFREYITLKTIYGGQKDDYSKEYIDICEKLIDIIPSIVSYSSEIKEHASYRDFNGQIMGYGIFKELSIYYQKQNQIDDAIRVCEKGIDCGYIDDGTKSGMHGRLQRLLKKQKKIK